MANEIKDLGALYEAIGREFDYANYHHNDYQSNQFHDFIGKKVTQLLAGNINEADYIKQWSEHDARLDS